MIASVISPKAFKNQFAATLPEFSVISNPVLHVTLHDWFVLVDSGKQYLANGHGHKTAIPAHLIYCCSNIMPIKCKISFNVLFGAKDP